MAPRVAIPSNRVNVSYIWDLDIDECESEYGFKSQSPQIGSMFPTNSYRFLVSESQIEGVAIPSNRVNVSYAVLFLKRGEDQGREVAIPSNRVNVSYKERKAKLNNLSHAQVAIPSNRVNVSYELVIF